MNVRILFLLLFFSTQIVAQDAVRSISLNFRKNKFDLSKAELKALDEFLFGLKNESQYSLIIKGFTDSDADSAYNYALSAKRCQTVNNHLIRSGVNSGLIQSIPMGEELADPEEIEESVKIKNRRVDVIALIGAKIQPQSLPVKNKCNRDTLVELGHGVIATFNACDYQKNKECVVLRTQKKVRYDLKFSRFRMKLGLKNYYKVKKKYVSYEVGFYCKDSTCGKLNASFLIPFFDVNEKQHSVQKFDSSTMNYQNYPASKIKSVKKKRYVQLQKVDCGYSKYLGKSCDTYLIHCGGFYPRCACKKSKIKFKNGLKVVDVNDISEIETNNKYVLSKNRRVLRFKPDDEINSIVLQDGKDTIKINDYIELSALKHGLLRSKSCSKHWFLFMQLYGRCDSFRKYKFKRKDIEIQQTKPWQQEGDK